MNLYNLGEDPVTGHKRNRVLPLYNDDGSLYQGDDGADLYELDGSPYAGKGDAMKVSRDGSEERLSKTPKDPTVSPVVESKMAKEDPYAKIPSKIPHYLDQRSESEAIPPDIATLLGMGTAPYRTADRQADVDDQDALGSEAHEGPYRPADLTVDMGSPVNKDYLRQKLMGAYDTSKKPPRETPTVDTPFSVAGVGSSDVPEQVPPKDDGSDEDKKPDDDPDTVKVEPWKLDDDSSGDEDAGYTLAKDKLASYNDMIDKGGPGYQLDWGPALALVDSWTGSHILNGYQHPKRPMSPEDLQKESLKTSLERYKLATDARQQTQNMNLKKTSAKWQQAQSELAFKDGIDDRTFKNTQTKTIQSKIDQANKGISDPLDQFFMDRNGKVSTFRSAMMTYGSKSKPAPYDVPKTDSEKEFEKQNPKYVVGPDHKPRLKDPGSKSKSDPKLPKITKSELQDQADAAFFARTGTKADKDNPKHQAGVEGYKKKIIQIYNTAPDAATARAKIAELIRNEGVARAAQAKQGTGALLNPKAPENFSREADEG